MDFVKELVRMTQYNRLVGELNGFMGLNPNWDGYDGIPINEKVYLNCISFLRKIDCSLVTDMFPNPNGTVTIEIEHEIFMIDCFIKNKFSLEIGQTGLSLFVKKYIKETLLLDSNCFEKELDRVLGILKEFLEE